ncbi:MAG: Phosphatidylglycerophosphatase A [Planctomycetes bacterium]|nr:Phosphatidylglycerophosphatase A [Planctomycetota bacterium]
MTAVAKLIVSFFGFGFSPVAPGTAGTFGAAVAAWGMFELFPDLASRGHLVAAAWIVMAGALTVLLTPVIEASSGRKDPGIIVLDEVAGYWATLAFLPRIDLVHLAAAFFVFRLFDIWKPFPAGWCERLPSGWGVLLDDVVGGLYGGAVLWAVDSWARAA